MSKIKIAAVSYLNTKPMLYGLESDAASKEFDIILDVPSKCADLLANNIVDIALIPVGSFGRFRTPRIISPYIIGSHGRVDTVLLLSNDPLEDIRRVHLDHHSNTSNLLARCLLHHHIKQPIQFVQHASEFDISLCKREDAVIMIGDKSLHAKSKFKYAYDLSVLWEEMTQLPFVFACWCSYKKIGKRVMASLNNYLSKGIDIIPQLANDLQEEYPQFDVKDYFENCIDYHLNEDKIKALHLYLNKSNLPLPKYLFENELLV